jgi:biopolymer transport protein ExbB
MDSTSRFMQLSEQSLGIIPILALMLAIVIAVVIERTVFFRRAGWAARMIERTLPAVDVRQDALLRQLAARFRPSVFADTLHAVAEASHLESADDMDRFIDEAIVRTLPRLDKHLWLLDAAVTLGPLIGLLGTIIGITESFNVFSAAGPNVQAMTGGVGHALIATGCGLAVAIVGVAANAYFTKRVRACMLQLDLLKLTSVKRIRLMKRPSAENAGHETHAPAMVPLKRVSNGNTTTV